MAATVAPGTPDLIASRDTGVSNTDNLTNLNNSTPETNLQFTVPGTVAGATVGIYSNGTLVGSTLATGTTTTVITDGSTTITDGLHSITARQTTPGNTASVDSTALPVTIDTTAPAYVGTPVFEFNTVKPQITLTFAETLGGFASGSITVFKNTAPAGVTDYKPTIIGNQVVLTFPNSPNGILGDGDYTVTFSPKSVLDLAGNVTAGATSSSFFYLAGDANRDRQVNFDDFLILQNAYNKPGNFMSGDFDYNGQVNFDDFLILQNNYNKSLPAPAPAASATLTATVPAPAARTASLSGTVFNDNNKNGKYDHGDGAAKGVRVFIDLDNDGVLDANETSVLTDSNGRYSFGGLAAGTYHVRQVAAGGYTATAAGEVTLASGQAKSNMMLGRKLK